MNKEAIKINELPTRTWRWLHVNESRLENIEVTGGKTAETQIPQGIQAADDGDAAQKFAWAEAVRTGMGAEFETLVKEGGAKPQRFVSVQKQADDAAVLKLDYRYADGEKTVSAVELCAEPGSEMTVVMQYASEENAAGFAGIQTKILAQKDAHVRLYQVQMPGSGFVVCNNIGAYCEEGATVELVQIALGGAKNYIGCETALAGDKSTFQSDTGYLVSGDGRLDMNYNAVHTGKEGTSQMNASGVLRDHAFKLFRGTIDFQRGSSGSVGDEKEDVLLMDNTVVNQTIPLILCAEEDVQGNHGATIGRLDDEIIFYLESRGLPRDEIYELMASARIEALSRRIPDDAVRKAVHARMSWKMDEED